MRVVAMRTRAFQAFTNLLGLVMMPQIVHAQEPAAPPRPPALTGSVSAGLAVTSGNTDTSTINAAYELKHENGGPIVIRSNGLLVYGKSQGVLANDRLALDGRVERRLTSRTSFFGQAQYLRDSFKEIDYLVSPTIGFRQSLLKDDRTELAVDGAAGVAWEQNPRLGLQIDGAVTAGEQFSRDLTATTEITQRVAALWKMNDFADAHYAFGIGVAASVTTATRMSVEFLDTYKAQPPTTAVKKNDISVLVSFVYKFD
jgi:putative salt-induced outer membrane protein YdiY